MDDPLSQLPSNPFQSQKYKLRMSCPSLLHHNSENLQEISRYSIALPSYQQTEEIIIDRMEKQLSLIQSEGYENSQRNERPTTTGNEWILKKKVVKNPFGGQDLVVSNQSQQEEYSYTSQESQKSKKRLQQFKKLKSLVHNNENYQNTPPTLLNLYKQRPIVKYKRSDIAISFGFDGFGVRSQTKQEMKAFKKHKDDEQQFVYSTERIEDKEKRVDKLKMQSYPRTLTIKNQTYHMISIS